MALAWKAGWVQALEGSNPSTSASCANDRCPTSSGGGSFVSAAHRTSFSARVHASRRVNRDLGGLHAEHDVGSGLQTQLRHGTWRHVRRQVTRMETYDVATALDLGEHDLELVARASAGC